MRVDVFGLQVVGQALVVLPELVGIGSVVVRDHDGIVVDADDRLGERKRTSFDDAMALMEWSDAMFKAVYPTRKDAVPLCDPERPVPVRLAADELQAILTKTEIAKTKKLRPRMEAMAAQGKTIDLEVNDWSRIILALCGPRSKKESNHKRLLKTAEGIASRLAEALHIDGPSRN